MEVCVCVHFGGWVGGWGDVTITITIAITITVAVAVVSILTKSELPELTVRPVVGVSMRIPGFAAEGPVADLVAAIVNEMVVLVVVLHTAAGGNGVGGFDNHFCDVLLYWRV